ncbi:MAG: hypothetical protein KAJ91_01660 [Candidatus Aenigmarchaeota archaeon]|nr:hypothetical protein [Candidatus Aenigmarchaeota archaeon]
MSLFGKKESVVDAQPPREILQEKIESLSTEMHEFKESTEKQMKEICSALNILDGDILDIKEDMNIARKKQCTPAEIKEIKKSMESLTVMGRLCLQNKEELEVLAKRVDATQESEKQEQDQSPVKILN